MKNKFMIHVLFLLTALLFTCSLLPPKEEATPPALSNSEKEQMQKGLTPYPRDNRTIENDPAYPVFIFPISSNKKVNASENPLMPKNNETLIGKATQDCRNITIDKNLCIERRIFEISQLESFKLKDPSLFQKAWNSCKNYEYSYHHYFCIQSFFP